MNFRWDIENGTNSPNVNGNEIFYPNSPWPNAVTSSSLHIGGSPISQNIIENDDRIMEYNGRNSPENQDSDSDSDSNLNDTIAVTAENFFNGTEWVFMTNIITVNP